MNKLFRLLLVTISIIATTVVSYATPVIFDFKAMGEPSGLGESAWAPLTVTIGGLTLTITANATKDGKKVAAYVYLDSNNAGLGVCANLISGYTPNTATQSSSNVCDPSTNDNISVGEALTFKFNQQVVIDRIWFNNNHDGDGTLWNNTINIDGPPPYTFAAGNGHGACTVPCSDPDDSFTENISWSRNANEDFGISHNNEEFYVSKMSISVVPEPASLTIIGLGLVGIGLVRKRLNLR